MPFLFLRREIIMKSSWIFALGVAGVINAQNLNPSPDCVNGPLAKNQVCNASLSPSARAAALVAAMTSDEKLQNLVRYVGIRPSSASFKKWCATSDCFQQIKRS